MATTYLMNTTICPCAGLWDVRPLALNRVAGHLWKAPYGRPEFVSAIGHESTAKIIETLLGKPGKDRAIPVNRITVAPEVGDTLICFKLKKRPPEGAILNEDQIESIGFEWFEMRLVAPSAQHYQDCVIATHEDRKNRTSEPMSGRRLRNEGLEPRGFLGGHRD